MSPWFVILGNDIVARSGGVWNCAARLPRSVPSSRQEGLARSVRRPAAGSRVAPDVTVANCEHGAQVRYRSDPNARRASVPHSADLAGLTPGCRDRGAAGSYAPPPFFAWTRTHINSASQLPLTPSFASSQISIRNTPNTFIGSRANPGS